jgi:hypothetical protein
MSSGRGRRGQGSITGDGRATGSADAVEIGPRFAAMGRGEATREANDGKPAGLILAGRHPVERSQRRRSPHVSSRHVVGELFNWHWR